MEEKKKTVLVSGGFSLERERLEDWEDKGMPESMLRRDYYEYTLVDSARGRRLLRISCKIPKSRENLNYYPIGVVTSLKKGNFKGFFPTMIGMIRRDLRKRNPNADIVSVTPHERIENYYSRELSAVRKRGRVHFPEQLPKRAPNPRKRI